MGEGPSNIRFGRKNGTYNFNNKDNGVQKSAFKNNAAAESIFKKYDQDRNNILDTKELEAMYTDIQSAAHKHNRKNMGKREAANFLGEEYSGTNAQKDILEFLNTMGTSADAIEWAYTDDKGMTTVIYNLENNNQITEIYQNIDGKSVLKSKTISNLSDNTETTIEYDEHGNEIKPEIKEEQQPKIQITKNEQEPEEKIPENNRTIIVQNGESPAAIAKKFGCNVDELLQLNEDKLKGKGQNKYFDVGAEIKMPNSVTEEKFNKASKSTRARNGKKNCYV